MRPCDWYSKRATFASSLQRLVFDAGDRCVLFATFNRMGDTYVLCTLYCRYSVTRRTVSKKRIRRNSPGAMDIFVIYPSTCIEVLKWSTQSLLVL